MIRSDMKDVWHGYRLHVPILRREIYHEIASPLLAKIQFQANYQNKATRDRPYGLEDVHDELSQAYAHVHTALAYLDRILEEEA